MAHQKLVGQNYVTPDQIAKVTGKAKYSEDFRAEGMLFTKLLLSPMPHARVKNIDLSAALAMPGVKAILTADDLQAPADIVTDAGFTIKANTRNEPALTNEPLYEGEPILAVAAVDELTAAEAIEKILVEYELLEFVTDPIESLKPNGPDPRLDGNYWFLPPPAKVAPGAKPAPPPAFEIRPMKWKAEDFANAGEGELPMGETTEDWKYGDLEDGFKKAALVLEETYVTPNTNHNCMEPRSAMAYWQNGKVYVHAGTQSTVQTMASVARALRVPQTDIVYVSEYTGGGFGSKAVGNPQIIIPALLSKKANAPVMMRITREEEHYIGGGRPSHHGRLKIGFAKDGRITALDMFVIADAGPYESGVYDHPAAGRMASLLYQPEAMRFRAQAVLTNSVPRRAQRQPGGCQAVGLIEPLLHKAAKQLGLDQVAVHKANAPTGKPKFGPADVRGVRQYATSAFVREALDKGAEMFNWDERKTHSGQRTGTKVRGVGVSTSVYTGGSVGFDGLVVIRPDGRVSIYTGVGNAGPGSWSACQRVTADILGVPWEQCEVISGNTTKNLPWSCVSGGSQSAHATSRAAHAVGMDLKKKLQQIAANTFGGNPDSYQVADGRVFSGSGSLTLAQAAKKAIELGGIFDGHETASDINAMTKRAVAAMVGEGLIGAARDNYAHDGATHSYVASFAEVEVDVETGKYQVLTYMAVADVGTVLHPANLGGQILGGGLQGIGHAMSYKYVYDQHYGVPLAKRFYQNRPMTILDAPAEMKWGAVDIADPETPTGIRGIGEPSVGAGYGAVLNAIADAVGDDVFRRSPVMLDMIITSLEYGHRVTEPLTANI